MASKNIFICSDNHGLSYNLWIPDEKTKIKAVVQILHGMAEYSDRYDKFAKYLNTKGCVVFAADHRGHGSTAKDGELGWFAPEDGWNRIAEDAHELEIYISSQFENLPVFLFGHSMGSFLARTLMIKYPDLYKGVIVMGTGCSKGVVGKIGKFICKQQIRKNGQKSSGVLMNKLSFGSYNKQFEPVRTDFDWLSRDTKEVDKYVNDPLCGFICTNGFFYDMLSGLEFANDKTQIAKIPRNLPILLISGDCDPVGDMGKGVEKVYKLYKDAGIKDLTLNLIPGARHELLNETNKKEVYGILSSWLLERL